MVFKIGLSEGHSKYTPGKRSPNGEREWFFNNLMGQGFREEIKKYSDVLVRVVSDPSGERDVPLRERTDVANSWGADILIDLHHNAYRGVYGTHTGTETYSHNGKVSSETLKLAEIAHKGIVSVYGLRDRGLKRANFHMLRESKMPAVLPEAGYMDSSIDIKVMRDKNKVKEAGRQIARNIAKEYGLKRKSGAKASEVTGTIYRVQVGAFKEIRNAAAFAQEVEKKAKVATYIVEASDYIRIQVGAFTVKSNAENQLKKMKDAGYKDAFITTKTTQAIPEAEPYNEPAPQPKNNLAVDGRWGAGTTKVLQKHYKTIVDGIISGQPNNSNTRNMYGVKYGNSGSLLIRAIQKDLRTPQDGKISGPTSMAIRALQKKLGTPQDGKISNPSLMVKEMQRRLNNGTF